MKSLILLLLLLSGFFPMAVYADRVTNVLDGDTIVLEDGRHIRLAGIDAPERHQPFGETTRSYLVTLVQGKNILLKCENLQGKPVTSYHRQVCEVYVDTLNIQEQLVMHGYAFDSTGYSHGRYLDLEAYARRNRLGMWRNLDLVFPWTYRHLGNKESLNTK